MSKSILGFFYYNSDDDSLSNFYEAVEAEEFMLRLLFENQGKDMQGNKMGAIYTTTVF